MLRSREATDQTLFQIWHVLDQHLGLLYFVDVNEIDAELEDVEFVLKAKFHYTGRSINEPRCIKVLPCQV